MDRNSPSNHKALIATKYSFTGVHWWLPLTSTAKSLAQHPSQPDYLLPQPDRHFHKLIPRPCQYHTALKWLRHILATNLCETATVASLTLHSLRLWAAEAAFQANVDRERRKYIGQWSQEATADIYTRDHRTVITAVWNELTAKLQAQPDILPPNTAEHPATAPKNPLDPIYFDTTATTTSTPPLPPPPRPPTTAKLPTVDKYPKHKGGPLTVVINNHSTGTDRKQRIHFYTPARTSVGCTTPYNPTRQNQLTTATDYKEIHATSRICFFCARHATLPPTWTTTPQTEDNDTDNDSHSSADSALPSNNTASEDEETMV